MHGTEVKVFGIAGWRLVPDEPRHNTWHNALYDASKKLDVDLEYLGLINTHQTNWITRILPDSVLKRFAYLSLYSFIKILKKIRSSGSKRTVIYIFEGSVSWLFFLGCISALIPNCVAICNLFSSSRYNQQFFFKGKMKLAYRILFKFIQGQERVWVTFDTQLMTNKLSEHIQSRLIRFPVPSSFPINYHSVRMEAEHHRVLVNLRSFPNKEIHELLRASCKSCTFVFPRGPLASTPLSIEFGHYSNASFDQFVIPVSEYQSYIDTFDYMIFLYQPSIDASGRILDSITRGVPVCVPRQASEWAYIAKTWGRSALFDWGSTVDTAKMFDHPEFRMPTLDSDPPFTPSGSLNEIINFVPNLDTHKSIALRILKPVIYLIILVHSIIASILGIGYQLTIWVKEHFSLRRNQIRCS
jgi:hypothetical protein